MNDIVIIIIASVDELSLPVNILRSAMDNKAPDALAIDRTVPVTNGLITFRSLGVNGKNSNSRDWVKIV